MTEEHAYSAEAATRVRYEIRVRGHLEDRRAASFEGFTVERQVDGSTVLAGEGLDQAALHAALRRIRDLGLPLLAVSSVPLAPAEAGPSDSHPTGHEGGAR